MTFEISKQVEFDAGHRVPLHDSKCRNPHGHRYTVIAHLQGVLVTEGSSSGMVRDFSHVKAAMVEHIIEPFDHSFIVSDDDGPLMEAFTNGDDYGWKINIVPFYPTAECLAKHFFELLIDDVPELIAVTVFETPSCSAMYVREEASDAHQ